MHLIGETKSEINVVVSHPNISFLSSSFTIMIMCCSLSEFKLYLMVQLVTIYCYPFIDTEYNILVVFRAQSLKGEGEKGKGREMGRKC